MSLAGWDDERHGLHRRGPQGQSGRSNNVIINNNVRSVDIAGVAETMIAVLAFTDSQLRTVWAAADRVAVEKRGVFLERVVARLQLRGSFTDADLNDAVRAALTGLIQSAA